MRLDLTITLGNVISVALMLGGMFVAYVKLREQLIAMDTKLTPLWDEYTKARGERRRVEERT